MADTSKVIIVTGGTHGIGLATTIRLAESGFRVLAFGVETRQPGSTAESSVDATRQLVDRRGLPVSVMCADVGDPDDVRRVVGACVDTFGRVDGLVNNAAIYPRGDILATDDAMWDEAIRVNLTGLYLSVREVLPHLVAQRSGSIVNVVSRASWGQPDLFAYSASKGGVLAATFALAYDHRRDGVRVNAVVPGAVRSGMTEELLDFGDPRFHSVAGRPTEPDDVASAISFLVSDDAATITGAVLNVNSFSGQGGPAR